MENLYEGLPGVAEGVAARDKRLLIDDAVADLSAATEINEGAQAPDYFADNAEVAEIAESLGRTLKLDALEQQGLAIIAEGEQRGGDQKSDQSEAAHHEPFTYAERQQRATARVIAENPEVVAAVKAEAAAQGKPASVRRVLKAVKKKKVEEVAAADTGVDEPGELAARMQKARNEAVCALAKKIRVMLTDQDRYGKQLRDLINGEHIDAPSWMTVRNALDWQIKNFEIWREEVISKLEEIQAAQPTDAAEVVAFAAVAEANLLATSNAQPDAGATPTE